MTVKELITELEALPPDAVIVFRHTRDDAPDDYETVDCHYWDGEAFLDIHSGEIERVRARTYFGQHERVSEPAPAADASDPPAASNTGNLTTRDGASS